VHKLVEREGETVSQSAQRMRLTVRFAAELLAEERLRLDLIAGTCDHIDNRLVRDLYERQRAADPGLTLGVLAHRAGIASDTHLARLLGYRPTTASVKNGKRYPGGYLTRIGVEAAAKIVRALGYAPAEIDGL